MYKTIVETQVSILNYKYIKLKLKLKLKNIKLIKIFIVIYLDNIIKYTILTIL